MPRRGKMDAAYYVAGIDVHKNMLAVVVANVREREWQFVCRRFGTTVSELQNLSAWLRERAVEEVVMESTETCVAGVGGTISALVGTSAVQPRPP
jgi:hypothetical protein